MTVSEKEVEAAKAILDRRVFEEQGVTTEQIPDFIREMLSAAASARADVPMRWQPIETATKDGTKIDLWCISHLHYAKSGRRVVNVAWGTVRGWMGNEREDWCHGFGEDLEPTHWMPIPASPEQGGE